MGKSHDEGGLPDWQGADSAIQLMRCSGGSTGFETKSSGEAEATGTTNQTNPANL
jgi:hypothetical protein